MEGMMEFEEMLEKLGAAAAVLEGAAERFRECEENLAIAAQDSIGRIRATADESRAVELERKLKEAEAKIAELTAASSSTHGSRKTVATMSAKEAGEGFDVKAMDVALASLTVEQRIAVKSELLRAGVIG